MRESGWNTRSGSRPEGCPGIRAKGLLRGFSLLELLVSMTVISLGMSIVAGLIIQNSRINKSTQMKAEVQSNARNSLSLISQALRTAGWDPLNTGFSAVATDPDLTDDVSTLEVFADLNGDGDIDDLGESVLIRHVGDQIEWRRSNSGTQPFEILGAGITNDADGDGVIEPMFTPDQTSNPTTITVQITARSPVPDPVSGQFIIYTISSDIVLRGNL
ncbi:MAG: PilW family protein [Acidobacteriota bacterium]